MEPSEATLLLLLQLVPPSEPDGEWTGASLCVPSDDPSSCGLLLLLLSVCVARILADASPMGKGIGGGEGGLTSPPLPPATALATSLRAPVGFTASLLASVELAALPPASRSWGVGGALIDSGGAAPSLLPICVAVVPAVVAVSTTVAAAAVPRCCFSLSSRLALLSLQCANRCCCCCRCFCFCSCLSALAAAIASLAWRIRAAVSSAATRAACSATSNDTMLIAADPSSDTVWAKYAAKSS